jgi:hypothetical protein
VPWRCFDIARAAEIEVRQMDIGNGAFEQKNGGLGAANGKAGAVEAVEAGNEGELLHRSSSRGSRWWRQEHYMNR